MSAATQLTENGPTRPSAPSGTFWIVVMLSTCLCLATTGSSRERKAVVGLTSLPCGESSDEFTRQNVLRRCAFIMTRGSERMSRRLRFPHDLRPRRVVVEATGGAGATVPMVGLTIVVVTERLGPVG